VKDILSRAVPATYFLLIALTRGERLSAALVAFPAATSSPEQVRVGLSIVQIVLELTFYLMVAALFVLRARTVARDTGPRATLIALAGVYGAAPLAFLPPVEHGVALGLVASVLMAVGLLACCLILGTLGRHFGVRPGARGVVSHGAYAHVRHPLYVAEAVTQLGLLITVISPLAVLTYCLYLALQYRRALLEERVLAATFPAYHEYQSRTSRFIPGLI
jgi:protein-S-isoprenylcysteine O-methyltransferase Ste14